MSILNKLNRHRVYLNGKVLPDPDGRIVLNDDPVLLAMERICEAALRVSNALVWDTFSHAWAVADSTDVVNELKDALSVLTEKTDE